MTLRRAVFLLACSAIPFTACKKESAPPPAVVEQRGAAEALGQMESAAAAFAKSLTEEQVKGVLVYEREMLQHASTLMGAPGQGADAKMGREERMAELSRITRAALDKAGVSQSDVTHFTTLTAELFAGEVTLENARRELAENPAKVERWKALEAEAEKLPDPEKFAFLQQHVEEQPLTDFMVKAYEEQISRHDALRKGFAERHGAQVLELLDRHQADFVALRKQQLEVVLGRK